MSVSEVIEDPDDDEEDECYEEEVDHSVDKCAPIDVDRIGEVDLGGCDAVNHNVLFFKEGKRIRKSTLTEGDLLPGEKDNIYINTNQGWFKPTMPVADFLKAYSLAGGTHHSAMVYDADLAELKTFGEMMGFEVIVIGA